MLHFDILTSSVENFQSFTFEQKETFIKQGNRQIRF